MNICEAVRAFRSSDSEIRGELVIRRLGWQHGRVLIPGEHCIYMTTIGHYPIVPTAIQLDPDEVCADDWQLTTRAEMLMPPPREKRNGRRHVAGAV